jgi:hypothetical protein
MMRRGIRAGLLAGLLLFLPAMPAAAQTAAASPHEILVRHRPERATTSTALLTANPYLGTPLTRYDPRINRYSADGALNPYSTGGGRIYGQDGTYLGRLNSNRYDPESVANPYSRYGSPYSSTSIHNPYGRYGSRYSDLSATNPYATRPPVVVWRR